MTRFTRDWAWGACLRLVHPPCGSDIVFRPVRFETFSCNRRESLARKTPCKFASLVLGVFFIFATAIRNASVIYAAARISRKVIRQGGTEVTRASKSDTTFCKKGRTPPLTAADVNYILPYQRKNAKYIPLHVTLTSSIDQECSTILGFGRFTNRLPIARLRSARKTCITFKRQGRRLLYRRTLSTGVLWFSREQLQIWIHNVFLVTRKKNKTNNPSTTIPFDIYLL